MWSATNCNFYYSLLGIETKITYGNIISYTLNCNFYYSLLGIETKITFLIMPIFWLQFLLLPIRDWNCNVVDCPIFLTYCNFYYSLLGIETRWRPLDTFPYKEYILQFLLLPIRDWNTMSSTTGTNSTLQFLLLPIRDWNINYYCFDKIEKELQFLLLPIRDWNSDVEQSDAGYWGNCNFYYSLLGIETGKSKTHWLMPDCNFYYSLLGIETPPSDETPSPEKIAISITPY